MRFAFVLSTYLASISFSFAAEKIGTIGGHLGFPSDFVPPLKVCALDLKSAKEYCVDTKLNAKSYSLKVPPGIYHVFASPKERKGHHFDLSYRAYYSDAVACGFKPECRSHKPLEVVVGIGDRKESVDPKDWYAP